MPLGSGDYTKSPKQKTNTRTSALSELLGTLDIIGQIL